MFRGKMIARKKVADRHGTIYSTPCILRSRSKEISSMQANKLLFLTALMACTAQVKAQGLLQTIISPEKAVATVTQTLEGTWMAELRPPGLPAAAPAIPNISTFGADGSLIASGSDGTQ